jgi:hypothetical protein
MNFSINATAIRVFYGFRNPGLTEARFLETVGHTFMPGTPYMLRELGLASYTAGVLLSVADTVMPHEFALIGYATADTYQWATRGTLEGRMYSQTHGGVYDSARSHAAFPIELAHLPEGATDPFFTWGDVSDWQDGRIAVFVGRAQGGLSGRDFRRKLRDAITTMPRGGNDLLICLPEDQFCILWVHSPDVSCPTPDWSPLTGICTAVLSTIASRVAWRDAEPPGQDFASSTVLNWIFVRNERYFLR